jgi:hypothetical protein
MSNTPPEAGKPSRRRVPFFGHQIAEYVVAIALIAVGFHLSGGAEASLLTAGFLLAVLNIVTKGPLGAFPWLSRAAHHAGDVVVAALLAVAPVFAHRYLHVWGIVLSEAVAVLIVWMERATRYTAPPVAKAGDEGAPTPSEPGVVESAGIVAGMLGPGAARASRVAARRAGLVAGVTRRVIRQHREAR